MVKSTGNKSILTADKIMVNSGLNVNHFILVLQLVSFYSVDSDDVISGQLVSGRIGQ